MTAHQPTPEQAERIMAAIEEARRIPSEQEQRMAAVEMAIRQTGDGLPDDIVQSLIDMIHGREQPRPSADLLDQLLGHVPDNLFEGLGQLVAIRRLAEDLAFTLLATLTDEEPDPALKEEPRTVFARCAENAHDLTPELRDAVTADMHNCRHLQQIEDKYSAQALVRYRTGRFAPIPEWEPKWRWTTPFKNSHNSSSAYANSSKPAGLNVLHPVELDEAAPAVPCA